MSMPIHGVKSKLRTTYKWALKALRVKSVRIAGIRLPVSRSFAPAMRKRLHAGRYEASEIALLRRHLAPSDRVLEFGAGLGFLASACAKIVGSDSVVTVEANPDMHPYIHDTFRLNRVAPNLICAAVGAADGTSVLHINDNFWSTSTRCRPGVVRTIEVETISFASLVERVSPTFLIIDIEGAEIDLVSSPIADSVRCILIEVHKQLIGDDAIESVCNWLMQSGFHKVDAVADESTLFWRRPVDHPHSH